MLGGNRLESIAVRLRSGCGLVAFNLTSSLRPHKSFLGESKAKILAIQDVIGDQFIFVIEFDLRPVAKLRVNTKSRRPEASIKIDQPQKLFEDI